MENAIEIKGLSKSFKDFKLDNVDITLPKGYIMGFIGPNGAGKSTTINLMLNLLSKDEGKITLYGKDNTQLSHIDKEQIGVVLDESCFCETLTVKDVDKIMKNIYKNWQQDKFNTMVRNFGLAKDKKIRDYSKGMKMKLSIACAMCHEAKLLILDEATSGLDPVVRDQILDMLFEFVQNPEHAVFISSHIIRDLEKICDYIAFINDGKIILNMEKDAMLEKYAVLRCKNEEFASIDPKAVIGYRKNSFATDALVIRDKIPQGFTLDKASIEDIMLYYIKEAK